MLVGGPLLSFAESNTAPRHIARASRFIRGSWESAIVIVGRSTGDIGRWKGKNTKREQKYTQSFKSTLRCAPPEEGHFGGRQARKRSRYMKARSRKVCIRYKFRKRKQVTSSIFYLHTSWFSDSVSRKFPRGAFEGLPPRRGASKLFTCAQVSGSLKECLKTGTALEE